MPTLKSAIKDVCPPILWEAARSAAKPKRDAGGFRGPFPSWEAAKAGSTGWNSAEILAKALAGTQMVLRGEAEFEQDTIIRKHIRYSPLVLAFLHAAALRGEREIVDIGGSFATNYLQSRKLLPAEHKWQIIEIPELVAMAQKELRIPGVSFHYDLNEIPSLRCVMFSGSLQMIEHPFDMLQRVIDRGAEVVGLDRVLVSTHNEHRIYVQQPGSDYYQSNYPSWRFSLAKLKEWFAARGFRMVEHFTDDAEREFDQCGLLFARTGPAGR